MGDALIFVGGKKKKKQLSKEEEKFANIYSQVEQQVGWAQQGVIYGRGRLEKLGLLFPKPQLGGVGKK